MYLLYDYYYYYFYIEGLELFLVLVGGLLGVELNLNYLYSDNYY